MNKRFIFLLASFYLVYQVDMCAMQNNEKPFVVVIASYNNIKWYKKNLDALIMQNKNYSNWRAIYVDDCSTEYGSDGLVVLDVEGPAVGEGASTTKVHVSGAGPGAYAGVMEG